LDARQQAPTAIVIVITIAVARPVVVIPTVDIDRYVVGWIGDCRSHFNLYRRACRRADAFEATNGAEAIELLESGKFDVVFAEYSSQTGKLDELVHAARKTNAKLPVIVTAPQSTKMDELKKTCPAATTYLTMPFSTDQLWKTIDQHVPSIAG
jgi:DNA-binding NtrC family response regulator